MIYHRKKDFTLNFFFKLSQVILGKLGRGGELQSKSIHMKFHIIASHCNSPPKV